MQNMDWNEDGQRRPYFPNLFSTFDASIAAWDGFQQQTGMRFYQQGEYPVQGPVGFPFASPPALNIIRQAMHIPTAPPTLSVGRMYALPCRTRDDSRTNIAEAIMTLPRERQLHQVRCSAVFWDNLEEYAKASDINRPNTYAVNDAIANRGSQVRAIGALYGWFQKQIPRTQHLVNSEPDVQDVIYSELVSFANEELKVRYPNHIDDMGSEEMGNYIGWDPTLNQAPTDATMPAWKKPVAQSHINGIGVQEAGTSKAGYPDYVLYYAPATLKQSAIIEIKTFWSYREQLVRSMFSEALTDSNQGLARLTQLPDNELIPGHGGGYFDWRNSKPDANILKQIWGELVFFNVRWGIWTNGKIILAFVITGRYDANNPGSANQLTFSKIMDITVPNRIHLGFLGLCFASLDEIGDMRGQHHAQNLADILCPEFSRHNPLEPEWFDHH